MGVREAPNQSLEETLVNYLRAKRLLLVLDNCEHLIDACAVLADKLLSASAELKLLATSREALGITGEAAWRVPSFAWPDVEHLPPLEQLAQYAAIQLFVQRAAAVMPQWRLNGNAPSVVRVCARLDGIPLAIELAAARLKVLSVEQIATRLDDRFRLLTSGNRTSLPRQQTLRAMIDWSYDLLSDAERVVLQRLSVFAGGWTLEAAEFVCEGDGIEAIQILDFLSRLVDKSLVIAEECGGAARYRMLETIKQYAHEKLTASSEAQRIRDRHLDHFLKFAEHADPKMLSREQFEWMIRLDNEYENLRTALHYAIKNNVVSAINLANALLFFWFRRGHLKEGREWVDKLISRADEWRNTAMGARLLYATAFLVTVQHDYASARLWLEEALRIARMFGEKRVTAMALAFLSQAGRAQQDYRAAHSFAEEALDTFRELQDDWGVGFALYHLGNSAFAEHDYSRANDLYSQSLNIYRQLGDQYMIGVVLLSQGEVAWHEGDYRTAGAIFEESTTIRNLFNKSAAALSLSNLAWVVLHEGNYQRAKALFRESLDLSKERGDKYLMILCIAGLACLLGATGKPAQAAHLIGAMESLREGMGLAKRLGESAEQMEIDHYVIAVRAQIDETTFAIAWTEGRALTLEQAIEYALHFA
ncbi:MAG: hypothetical protein HY782_15420 [Chloroflexi bacterium]|nr:hypothetical protein [Chloroflexota bacterium]